VPEKLVEGVVNQGSSRPDPGGLLTLANEVIIQYDVRSPHLIHLLIIHIIPPSQVYGKSHLPKSQQHETDALSSVVSIRLVAQFIRLILS
jgi:hypothetical protein